MMGNPCSSHFRGFSIKSSRGSEIRNRDTRAIRATVPADIQAGVFTDPRVYLKPLVDSLVASTGNPALRIKYIHDWIAANICYNWPYYLGLGADVATDPYDLLVARETVCAGYAALFREMCRLAGIEAPVVSGPTKAYGYLKTGELESHAWNVVNVNGEYRFVDVTWDSNNSHRDSDNDGVFEWIAEPFSPRGRRGSILSGRSPRAPSW